MPKEVFIRIERPAGYEEMSDTEWREKLTAAIADRECAARSKRREDGRGVLGRKGVLRVSPDERPSSVEPRRTLRPCIGCLDKERRKIELAVLCAFRLAYRIALQKWRAGARETIFPRGTYALLASGVATS